MVHTRTPIHPKLEHTKKDFLLWYCNKDCSDISRMLAVLLWTRVSSFLLSLPPLLARDSFLDLDSCSVRGASDVASSATLGALVVYVAVVAFFLPSCVLAPAFLAWTGVRQKINVGEFEREDEAVAEEGSYSDGLMVEEAPELVLEWPVASGSPSPSSSSSSSSSSSLSERPAKPSSMLMNFLGVPSSIRRYSTAIAQSGHSVVVGDHVSSIGINRLQDRDFPAVLFVFAISQVPKARPLLNNTVLLFTFINYYYITITLNYY